MAIEHRVYLRFKEGVNISQARALLASLQERVTLFVEGQPKRLIRHFKWLENSSEESVAGPRYGFVMVLADPTAGKSLGEKLIATYLDHPAHLEVKARLDADYLEASPTAVLVFDDRDGIDTPPPSPRRSVASNSTGIDLPANDEAFLLPLGLTCSEAYSPFSNPHK